MNMQNRDVHCQRVRRYRTTLWTLICMFVPKHKITILCPYAPHAYVPLCTFLWPIKDKCWGRPPHLTDIRPPCAPWCTTQVGAQCRSVVHNVVLYSRGGAQRGGAQRGGAQCRSHKSRQNHGQKGNTDKQKHRTDSLTFNTLNITKY